MTDFTSADIVCLLTGREGYGIRRVWKMLLNDLPSRGFRVHATLLDGTKLEEWKKEHAIDISVLSDGSRIRTLQPGMLAKAIGVIRRISVQAGIVLRLRSVLRSTAAKTLIVQSPLEVLLAGFAATQLGVQVIWMVPNIPSNTYPFQLNLRLYRFAFKRLGVVPVSNSFFTDASFGDGSFERKVIHLGVDLNEFSAAPIDRSDDLDIGLNPDRATFGLFARLTESKGQSVLLEALAGSKIYAQFIICGGPADSEYAAKLVSRTNELKLEKSVYFVGHKVNIARYLNRCDVVMNLRIDPEPFGLSVIEAMACGRPVLAHASGGPRETVVDGETGWLFDPPMTAEVLSSALDRALSDRARWREMGEAARRHAASQFSKAAMMDSLVKLLPDVDRSDS